MQDADLITHHQWSLGSLWGSSNPFFLVQANTIISTWVVLGIIIAGAFIVNFAARKKYPVLLFCCMAYAKFFVDLCDPSLGSASRRHLPFIATLFTFLLLCNTASVIPFVEEPTADINTALAFGLIAFFYTQCVAIAEHGIMHYIKGFFTPFFIMLPLNIISKISTIVSLSFRLFGNIFGGAVITAMYLNVIGGKPLWEILGLVTGLNMLIMLFFGIFEGFLQAFVFAMLTLTQISLALQKESGH